MAISMREAIRYAIRDEMRRDPCVVVFGEDVAEGGGVFKVTEGLLAEFGPMRVRDTPISEMAIAGAALGAAASGLRPVLEIMFVDFLGVCLDQIATQAAKVSYLSAGRIRAPLVVRAASGGGMGFGAQHSQTLETWLLPTPGLTVVSPSGAREAYGLLRSAIQSDDPVVFLEPKALYGSKEEFEPDERAMIPLSRAAVIRPGTDITVVALGQMVRVANEAARELGDEVSCEVIDLRTIRPWDRETVVESVRRTGRLLVVEEDPFTGGWGTEIVSYCAATCFMELQAPPSRVTCPDAMSPSNPKLERAYLPGAADVIDAARHLCREAGAPPVRWESWRVTVPSDSGGGPASEVSMEPLDRRAALGRGSLQRLERMMEIRSVEDRILQLFSEGLVAGSTHTCQGQEAVAVAIGSVARADDVVTCTYRGHGVALALGMTPFELIAEVLGRRDGCVGGKGGSMHLCRPDVGLFPTFAIVGSGIPVAAGAAYAFQAKGQDNVAVAVFGDGATNIGAFHETLNLAAVWRLPIVFMCENNLYGEYSRLERTTPLRDLADRAASYAMPGVVVDGQDLDAVIHALDEAIARARDGSGPTLVEAKTYRYAGHSRGDSAKYRRAGELEQWRQRDPIDLYATRLLSDGTLTSDGLAEIRAGVERTVSAAVAAALASPDPDVADILVEGQTA